MKRVATSLFLIVFVFGGSAASIAADGGEPSVVINEVCWGGASWDSTAEWIELFNLTDEPIDLEGWILASSDGAPYVSLGGVIAARNDADETGYYLLERDSDDAVPGVAADMIYRGALTDAGEVLTLIDADGRIVDTANAMPADDGGIAAWPAGRADRAASVYASMERVTFEIADIPSNWTDSGGTPPDDDSPLVPGTPRGENAAYNVPPVAQIDIVPAVPQPGVPARFDASRSSDANDLIVAYHWDFGDGATSDGQVVEHAYADAGEYAVTLIVTDSKGGQAILFENVQVAATTSPVVDFSIRTKAGSATARVGDLLAFQDESYDADGELVSWAWAFGDGATAAAPLVTHAYEAAGTYVVSLTVTDAQREAATQTQALTIAARLPVAVFSYAPDPAHAGDSVQFDAAETAQVAADITSYLWDFDGDEIVDVQTSSSRVQYVYPSGGSYTVRLTVVNEHGDRASRERTLTINEPPQVQFQVSTFEPDELESVTFTDLSWDPDGIVAQWLWEFGDGSSSDEQTPSHVYYAAGSMRVLLTVTDDSGAWQTDSATINVANLPPCANLTASSTSLPTGTAFTFDASGSSDPSPDGCITLYEWSIGADADFTLTTEEPTLSQTFDATGQVTVRVRVTDDDGATAVSDPVTVTVTNRIPTVSRVQWTPTSPIDGESVTFTVTASDADGQISGWSWSVDGVVRSSQETFTVAFEDDGDYVISVQVKDNAGGTSTARSVTVGVANAAPVAAFTTAQSSTCGPSGIRFDASGSHDASPSGNIVHIAWDFGDGTHCPGTSGCDESEHWTPEHCYSSPGTYTVTLVVIDDDGAIGRVQRTVTISE